MARRKKESFITNFINGTITLGLAGVMILGLQGFGFSAQHLKFAQVSDAHFYTGADNTTFKLRAESSKLLDDAVNQINETPDVDFVMFTGDLVDKSFEKEVKAFLPHAEKLKYPWYFTFGNHDTMVGGYLTPQLYMDLVKKSNPDFKFNTSYYSFEPKRGFKVIVLDTIIRDRLTSNGFIDKKQLEWLDSELKNSQKDTVLIFTHVPVIEPFPSPGHRLLNAAEVQSTIEKYKNPIGVFQGHYHAAKIIPKENVIYVSTPSLVSYPNAFRMINVTNYKKRVVFDIKFKETRETNIQTLAKLMVFSSNLYSGEENDRSAAITIRK